MAATTIFIGGFPLEISELELVQLVSPYGEVSTIRLVRDKATRKCKGYGFMERASREAAENAVLNLDGAAMGGRVLTLNIKEEEPVRTPVYKKVERHTGPVKKKRPRRPL